MVEMVVRRILCPALGSEVPFQARPRLVTRVRPPGSLAGAVSSTVSSRTLPQSWQTTAPIDCSSTILVPSQPGHLGAAESVTSGFLRTDDELLAVVEGSVGCGGKMAVAGISIRFRPGVLVVWWCRESKVKK